MDTQIFRRVFCAALGAVAAMSRSAVFARTGGKGFRVRTITAGVDLDDINDRAKIETAIGFLNSARSRFEDAGYEVQTVRISTPPLHQFLPSWHESAGENAVVALDRFCADNGVLLSVGPIITDDQYNAGFAPWAARMVQAAGNTNFTVFVASQKHGIHRQTIRTAAEAIASLAKAKPGGEGNFQFAATASCPPGTPFFPAAYHQGDAAFSIGLELPPLLQTVFDGAQGWQDAKDKLTRRMNFALGEVEKLALGISKDTSRKYLGIDTSPAPGPDASIGQAIETLMKAPFGSPSTLAACAAITDVLKGLSVKTCGYSGLMLPVLEDRVLADRANEGRYGVSELLLYSSVCGTGLDVVPLPGDIPTSTLAAIIGDVAALSHKYDKPLSARLFPVPGKQAGDEVQFESPFLMNARVMEVG